MSLPLPGAGQLHCGLPLEQGTQDTVSKSTDHIYSTVTYNCAFFSIVLWCNTLFFRNNVSFLTAPGKGKLHTLVKQG